MRRSFPVHPGVPAAGHLTGGGAWHPSRAEGCVKCNPPSPLTFRVDDRIVHVFRNRHGVVIGATRGAWTFVRFDTDPEHPTQVKTSDLSRETRR